MNWSTMKISNDPVKYEVLIKQHLRSILDRDKWKVDGNDVVIGVYTSYERAFLGRSTKPPHTRRAVCVCPRYLIPITVPVWNALEE